MFSNLSVPIWSSTHSSLPAALKRVLLPESQPEQRCVHNPGPRSPGMRPMWNGQQKQQLQLYGTERDQPKSDLLLLPRLPENLSSKLSPMLRTPRGTHALRYVGFRSFEYRVLKEYNSTHYSQLLLTHLQQRDTAAPSSPATTLIFSLSQWLSVVSTIHLLLKPICDTPSGQCLHGQFYHTWRPFMAAKNIQRSYFRNHLRAVFYRQSSMQPSVFWQLFCLLSYFYSSCKEGVSFFHSSCILNLEIQRLSHHCCGASKLVFSATCRFWPSIHHSANRFPCVVSHAVGLFVVHTVLWTSWKPTYSTRYITSLSWETISCLSLVLYILWALDNSSEQGLCITLRILPLVNHGMNNAYI